MATLGIIAEYNPFHNGHQALISTAKKQGYQSVVAVMSGNYVQRSQPAIAPKHLRARAALAGGVDLLLELPTPYATATAQRFAGAGVALLQATGLVDTLCFGSELGDLPLLQQVADLLDHPTLTAALAPHLAKGITFAKARSLALGELLGETAAEATRHPNNLLGIEYLAAARRLNWSAEFLTIPRFGVGHHSTQGAGSFASASKLRTAGGDLTQIRNYLPAAALAVFEQGVGAGLYPVNTHVFEIAVLTTLRQRTQGELATLPDLSEGIEHRLGAAIGQATSLQQLYEGIKTKRYPLSRVRRLVLAAFLGLTREDVAAPPPYLRILGFTPTGRDLLNRLKVTANLPFSHRLLTLEKQSISAAKLAQQERNATDLYSLMLPKPLPMGMEDRVSPIIV